MFRDGRIFYSTIFTSNADLTLKRNLSILFENSYEDYEKCKKSALGKGGCFEDGCHFKFLCEQQYSSDNLFLEQSLERGDSLFSYNVFIFKLSLLDSEGRGAYMIAAPLKRLASKIFSHVRSKRRVFEINYMRSSVDRMVNSIGKMKRYDPGFSVPAVDFYVYGDGGSDDIKICGSDPMKSKVYKSIKQMTREKSNKIRIAPCAATLEYDDGKSGPEYFDIYFKGVLYFKWSKSLDHLKSLGLVLSMLSELNILEHSSVPPSWLSDKKAKTYLSTD